MNKENRGFTLSRLALAAAVMSPALVVAAEQAGTVLVATQGVKAIGADGSVRELSRRSPVYSGDKLVTASGARAQVRFTDGSIVGLKPNTEISIDQYAYEPQGAQAMFMSLVKGGLRTLSGAIGHTNKKDYRLTTPVATIGIRGTLHEESFNPDTGLALGVWDGGINACNNTGCLDLGLDADYRFGFIGLDGKAQGRNTPPEGIGGNRNGGGDGEGAPSGEGALEDLAGGRTGDEDRGLHLPDNVRQIEFEGFALVSRANAPQAPDAYPWDPRTLLAVEDASVIYGKPYPDATQDSVLDWSLRIEESASHRINWGMASGLWGAPEAYYRYNAGDGMPWLVWGRWYGGEGPSIGVGTTDTDTPVADAGSFIFGVEATPDMSARLAGTTTFHLMGQDYSPFYTQFPQVLTNLNPGQPSYDSTSQGYLRIDVATGNVDGGINFRQYDYTLGSDNLWQLAFGGTVASGQLALGITAGTDGTSQGSWYRAANSGPGSEFALDGSIVATLLGVNQVSGLVGSFDVATTDATDSVYAQGIFAMTRDAVGPALIGFGTVLDGEGLYPWGAAGTVKSIAEASVVESYYYGESNWVDGYLSFSGEGAWSMRTANMDGTFLNNHAFVDQQDPTSGNWHRNYTGSNFSIEWSVPEADPTARLYWGSWDASGASFGAPGMASTDVVYDAGTFGFGTEASPLLVAAMAGRHTFHLFDDPNSGTALRFVDSSGYVQTDAGDSYAGMTLNATTGAVSDGVLEFAGYSTGIWHMEFSGQLAQGKLGLSVIRGADGPGFGSWFLPYGTSAGNEKGVDGTIQMSFMGVRRVDWLLGAFDVATNDALDSAFAHGVFVLEPDASPVLESMAGFAVTRSVSNIQRIDDARLGSESQAGYLDYWALHSQNIVGGQPYFVSGCLGCNDGGDAYPQPAQVMYLGTDMDATLAWGNWIGNSGYAEVSLSDSILRTIDPLTGTSTPALTDGLFAVGTSASPAIVAQMTGVSTFRLFDSPLSPSPDFPLFYADIGSPTADGNLHSSTGSQGVMIIDASGIVGGELDFDDSLAAGELWHLEFLGTLAAGRLNLLLQPTKSWFSNDGGSTNSSVNGSVSAEFIGASAVEGILGSFDVATVNPLDDNAAKGLFYMGREKPFAGVGYAAVGGTSNPWGAATQLDIASARLTFAADGQSVISASLFSPTANNHYLLPGCVACSGGEDGTPPAPQVLHNPADPDAFVVWGYWAGNDVSVSSVDQVVPTTAAVSAPGVYIVGTQPDPTAVLTGVTSFTLNSPFPYVIETGGAPASSMSASGSMTVDPAQGTVSGSMMFQMPQSDWWNIAFNGTVTAQQMALNVIPGADGSPNNTHYFPVGGTTGSELAAQGTITGSFVGATEIGGVVGSFNVNTVSPADAHAVQGVYFMTNDAQNPQTGI